ncbi:spore germination protein [Cohnella hashimotonis]|uniref:Spore germination protein n=1 Tax=Cohnella hashimotonis TaxID=2826895 RepID=A0ABT6TFB4_9BACL|nr:spore germination protein [Cohnella hashimotonis]MDI4644978.1 spore germination protein [Cohnella hashimotonis]
MNLPAFLMSRQNLDSDLFLHPTILTDQPVVLAGYNSQIDLPQTIALLRQMALNAASADKPPFDPSSGIGTPMNDPGEREILDAIAAGQMLIFSYAGDRCMKLVPVHRTLSRAIEAPTTENVLRGAISAFNEDLDTNIGLVKKHFSSEKLRLRSYALGGDQRRRTALLYMEGQIHEQLLQSIVRKIEALPDRDVPDLEALSDLLGFSKWTLITRYNTTELPQEAASALARGKAVLLLDRFPFALVLPSLVSDLFVSQSDRNFPVFFKFSFQVLRVLGVLTNVLLPGLYVALVSVNPEVLRIEIALSIAGSREGVPYPALVETLLLLLILELTLESTIRLPKTIGPTITMVGGIILGQAVVQANLVSNVLIIILAASTIANFTVIGFQNTTSLRLYKYLLLFLSAMFGVLGLFVGIVVICAYLGQVSTFGIPYLSRWKAGRRYG